MAAQNSSCVFFKKKRSRQAVRNKKDSSSSEDEVQVSLQHKRRINTLLYQQTSNFVRKTKGISDDEETPIDPTSVMYKASHASESRINREQVATATLDIDTDHVADAQAIFERAHRLNKDQGSSDSNIYRGANNYNQYIEKRDTVMGNASSGFNRKGPMRAPSNIRSTVRWDYQPDICKDYKETGFCSFGDSCKFLHDRSDYKHGWQIEQELAEGVYGIDGSDNRYEIIHHSSDDELDDAAIPWECLICREDYKEPVVTNCKHYFCGECALKRYKKTARCYACTADTKGFFKYAKDLIQRVAKLREKRSEEKNDQLDEEDETPEGREDGRNVADIPPATHHTQSALVADAYASDSSHDGDSSVAPRRILPMPAEPNWAQPEALEYCNTDEESD